MSENTGKKEQFRAIMEPSLRMVSEIHKETFRNIVQSFVWVFYYGSGSNTEAYFYAWIKHLKAEEYNVFCKYEKKVYSEIASIAKKMLKHLGFNHAPQRKNIEEYIKVKENKFDTDNVSSLLVAEVINNLKYKRPKEVKRLPYEGVENKYAGYDLEKELKAAINQKKPALYIEFFEFLLEDAKLKDLPIKLEPWISKNDVFLFID